MPSTDSNIGADTEAPTSSPSDRQAFTPSFPPVEETNEPIATPSLSQTAEPTLFTLPRTTAPPSQLVGGTPNDSSTFTPSPALFPVTEVPVSFLPTKSPSPNDDTNPIVGNPGDGIGSEGGPSILTDRDGNTISVGTIAGIVLGAGALFIVGLASSRRLFRRDPDSDEEESF